MPTPPFLLFAYRSWQKPSRPFAVVADIPCLTMSRNVSTRFVSQYYFTREHAGHPLSRLPPLPDLTPQRVVNALRKLHPLQSVPVLWQWGSLKEEMEKEGVGRLHPTADDPRVVKARRAARDTAMARLGRSTCVVGRQEREGETEEQILRWLPWLYKPPTSRVREKKSRHGHTLTREQEHALMDVMWEEYETMAFMERVHEAQVKYLRQNK